MKLKQIWINHNILMFKLASLLLMVVFFIFSGWEGIVGFFLGLCYISYLIFTDNPQFNAVILAIKFKRMGDANNEIFKQNQD